MEQKVIIAAMLGLLSLPVAAQEQGWKTEFASAMDENSKQGYKPPRIDPLSGPDVKLRPKEKYGLRYGRQWADNPDFPARGDDGSVVFLFGATLPVLICAPLYVCDLTLEQGEVVNDINIGDAVRWQITPAVQGNGAGATTHIIIKPKDVGLVTNLILTTDRRAYTIKLISRRRDWMPRVSFHYPDQVDDRWRAYRAQQERLRQSSPRDEGDTGGANFHFGYEIKGDNPSWRPIRVYSGSGKTYIQFPRNVRHGDLPALVALADDGGLFSEPSKQLVNYRYVNGRFEVDKILEKAALISGVGWDQVEVRINRRRPQ